MAATPSRVELFVPPAAEAGLLVEIDDLRAPTRRLLRVSGELDLATVGVLGSAIQRAAADRREVELDVSGVAFCDVVGATALEQAQQQLQARGCQLILRGIDGPLHLLLAVDGLFGTLRRSTRPDGQEAGPADQTPAGAVHDHQRHHRSAHSASRPVSR